MSYPHPFFFRAPAWIEFSPGALDKLPALIKQVCPVSKVLIVTDPGLMRIGLADRVAQMLNAEGIGTVIFAEVEENPLVATMDRCAAIAKEAQVEGVIGLGGGSPMDVAKISAMLMTNPGGVLDYEGIEKVKNDPLPVIAIPTTAGTGSEVTKFAVHTDPVRKAKPATISHKMVPKLAVLDPLLTVSKPPRLTAATGMDALTHAIESYCNVTVNPIADSLSTQAIRLIGKNLPVAVWQGKNVEARYNMMLGSLLAGMSFTITALGIVHAMSHPVGAHFNIPHGIANAILLPHIMEWNLPGCVSRTAEVGRLLGVHTDGMSERQAAAAAVEAVRQLNRDIGIPDSYRELGVPLSAVDALAEGSLLGTGNLVNPRVTTLADYKVLWTRVLGG